MFTKGGFLRVLECMRLVLKKPNSRSCVCSEVNTAISRKVVGQNVHATIPKGNMGYDQHCSQRL